MRWLLLGVILMGGCVRREMTIVSEPAGALVYLNGQEVGRTPLTREFVWYGNYDVALRLEGYETLKTTQRVVAPIWQWPPLDLVAEAFPLTDRHTYRFELTGATTRPTDTAELLGRAEVTQRLMNPSTRPVEVGP